MVSTSTPSGLPRSSVPTPRSSFVFALGQSGAEPALRAELLSHGLSPAFGRDGFVSAKSTHPIGVDELPAMVLGRRVCLSLGKRADVDVAAVVVEAAVGHEYVKVHVQTHPVTRPCVRPSSFTTDFTRSPAAR